MIVKQAHNWLLPSLAALVLWGVWAFLPKIALETLSIPSLIFYEQIGELLIVIPILFHLKGKLEKNKQGIAIAACTSFISTIAIAAYYYALQLGPVGTISTLTAMYPVVVLILARIFLKDKINRIQCLAIGLAMVSIYLLAG